MYKKSMSVIVVLCLLGMGSVAFGGTFGGPWSFQGDWHNTDTSMCKPATNTTSNDWYNWGNWGMQNNGQNGCAVTLFDNYIFLAIEPKGAEPCVSTWNPAYPGADANGYDLYATQIFHMPWAWQYATAAYPMTITSGNINCGRMLALAYNVEWPASWNAYPVLDVNGGTVITPGYRNFDANYPYDATKYDDPCYPWYGSSGLWIGGGASGNGENWGIMNIRGTGKVIMPEIQLRNGEINIFPNGLLYHNDPCTTRFFISQARARNHINVAGGELRLIGDRMDQVLYYLSKGRLIPCDGHGDLNIFMNDGNTSVTSVCSPDSAFNPNPIDGAIAVPLSKTLSWSAGPRTQPTGSGNAHDVFFGTSEADVCDATVSNLLGVSHVAQDACSFNPGTLVMDTNYFWRVDENNNLSAPVGYWKGNIWAFKSKGPQASDPIPATDTAGIPLPLVLKWNPGAKAGAANGHAVFFGTSEADVTDSTILNPLNNCFKGYVTDAVYPLSSLGYTLVADVNYYWRIDEVNSTEDGSPWKGPTWHVLNTNYFVAEDFELYNDNATMQTKWKMGSVDYVPYDYTNHYSCYNSNGVIDFDFNDGDGALQFVYDNSISEHFSEIRFDANDGKATGTDWTGGAALPTGDKCRSLAIGFIGNPNNDADVDYDRMYAAIEDTAGNFEAILNSDSQAQRSFVWTQWYINLGDLTDTNSVSLTNIKYLYIGFGDRCHGYSIYGGNGRVRIDDIRLYQKTCLPTSLPVGDLTGDCKVNYLDVDVMANTWLASQTVLPTVTNPGTTGLRLWYQFNETTGITVTDSSGNGFHGDVNCTPTFADSPLGLPTTILWDPTGGYDGSSCIVSSPIAISDYNMSIEADANALDANGTSMTLTVWVNGDTYMPLSGWARMVCAFQDINTATDDDNEVIEIQCPVPSLSANSNQARFKIGPTVGVEYNQVGSAGLPLSAFAGSWQHYAFVRDGTANKIRIYHNGENIADANALATMFRHNVPFESFRIFRRNQGSEHWYGKMDDFRVYNRALSDAEVGWLGTRGTGNVPFQNTSNIKSSTPEKISFNDLAILAKNWMVYQSWPNP